MSTMNSILEKFMFNNSENGAGKATKFHDMIRGLTSSPRDDKDARSQEQSRRFEAPRDQGSQLSEQIRRAEGMVELLEASALKKDRNPELTSALESLRAEIDSILSQKDSEHADKIWKLSNKIWNMGLISTQNDVAWTAESVLQLSCKTALEVFTLICDAGRRDSGSLELYLSLWRRLIKTGEMWMKGDSYEQAEFCFSSASETVGQMSSVIEDPSITLQKREEVLILLVNLYSKRGSTSLRLNQNVLLSSVVGKCKELSKSVPPDMALLTKFTLAEELFSFGEALLLSGETCSLEAISIFDSAIELLGDPSDASEDVSSESTLQIKNLFVRITKNLAHAHLKAKNYSAAQSVLTYLRPKLQPNPEKHHSFHFMSIQAALGLEKFEEAISILEGTSLTEEDTPNYSVHLEKFKICYANSQHNDHARIASIFVKFAHHSKKVEVVLKFVCFLLSSQDIPEANGTQKYENTISIVGDPKVTQLFQNEERKATCEQLYGILFNSAVANFQSKEFRVAQKLFQTCLLYASLNETQQKHGDSAKVLRCLSLVLCNQQEPRKAIEHLSLAKELEPDNILNDLIMIRLHITESDHTRCLSLIRDIAQSSDFHPKYLLSICNEALQSDQKQVACECLLRLYEHQKQSKQVTESYSTLLRCLVSLSEEKKDTGITDEVSKYLEEAHALFTEDRSSFLKDCDTTETLHWFAVRAWNGGLQASQKSCFKTASKMFEVSASFFENIENEQTKTCESLLYASVFLLDAGKVQPESGAADVTKLCMLVKALNVNFLKHRNALDEGLQQKISSHIPWLQYEIACHKQDSPTALQLLSEMKQISEDPKLFVKMALAADALQCKSNIVKTSALNMALKTFQNTLPLNYQGIAWCLRTLIELRSNDDEGIKLSSQALEIIRGFPDDTFPAEEIQWLATNAWNRGLLLSNFGETETGKRWMKIGVDLIPRCPALEGMKQAILSHYQGQFGDQDKGKNSSTTMEIDCEA